MILFALEGHQELWVSSKEVKGHPMVFSADLITSAVFPVSYCTASVPHSNSSVRALPAVEQWSPAVCPADGTEICLQPNVVGLERTGQTDHVSAKLYKSINSEKKVLLTLAKVRLKSGLGSDPGFVPVARKRRMWSYGSVHIHLDRGLKITAHTCVGPVAAEWKDLDSLWNAVYFLCNFLHTCSHQIQQEWWMSPNLSRQTLNYVRMIITAIFHFATSNYLYKYLQL